jgi:deazaflavin-dependent oxidoreductase (nitroreductase family)
MASTPRPPRAPRIVRLFNPLVQRAIGVGVPFGPNALLTVRGRTSGQPRTFPIAIIEHAGHRYVQSPFGAVNWVRNLRANGAAILARGSRREAVHAVELQGDAAGAVLRDTLTPYLRTRVGAAYLGRYYALHADSPMTEFVEAAAEHPVFELLPDPVG